jgi:hypothetical protein
VTIREVHLAHWISFGAGLQVNDLWRDQNAYAVAGMWSASGVHFDHITRYCVGQDRVCDEYKVQPNGDDWGVPFVTNDVTKNYIDVHAESIAGSDHWVVLRLLVEF